MQSTKEKIKTVIKEYIKIFPTEYEYFQQSIRIKQDNLQTEWAELNAPSEQIVRHLMDMPETLYIALRQNLNKQELDWLFSREEYKGKRAGIMWFIRAFPQFKITKDF